MGTIKIPESPKGAQMGAFEAINTAALLCAELRAASGMMERIVVGNTGSAQHIAGVKERLLKALEYVNRLEGEED